MREKLSWGSEKGEDIYSQGVWERTYGEGHKSEGVSMPGTVGGTLEECPLYLART